MYIESCHIDYLRLVIKITDPNHQDEIKKAVDNTAIHLSRIYKVSKTHIIQSKNNYNQFIRLPLLSNFKYNARNEETPHIVLQCAPIDETRYFIAIECKGHPYSREQFYSVRLWLEYIFSAQLLNIYKDRILLNRFDIALNTNLLLKDYLFDSKWSKKTALYTSAEGDLETLYIQPKNSALEICIYDRKSKVRNRNIKKIPTSKSRIEFRFGKNQIPLSNFSSAELLIEKAFGRQKIYDLNTIRKADILHEDQLLALTSLGFLPFIQKQSKYKRSRLREAISAHLITAIEPGSLPLHSNAAIRKLRYLLPCKSFKGSHEDNTINEFNLAYKLDTTKKSSFTTLRRKH